MRSVLFAFLIFTFSSNAQLNIVGPIEYSGYEESVRTVHFSEDDKTVLGDWDDVIEWDIASQKLLDKTEIPGYTINKSSYDGNSFWVNGNSNYNTEAKDITDMHNNFNMLDSSVMKPTKVKRPYGLSAIIKGTKDVIVAASTEKYTYQVVRLNTETFEETTIYFDENKHGTAVPTAIKVSDDGRYLGVSFAGEHAGVRIYDLESGTQLKYRESDADANDFAFSSDGNYVFVGDGASLVQINIKYWRDVRIWDVSGTITSLDVNSDGTYAVFSFQRKGAVLLNVQSGAIEANLGNGTYWDVTFSNNDELIGLGVSKRLKNEGIASVHIYQILK
ncbi:MAG: WD40 repeat domain-containing protein [Crocinitomicaceae bacterium]